VLLKTKRIREKESKHHFSSSVRCTFYSILLLLPPFAILRGEKMHFEHLTDTTVRMQSNNEEEEVKRIIIIAQ